MPRLPTVSVLMGAYNYGDYVGRALQSALEQDYPADRMEIIVVNDGSTDHTREVVAGFVAAHPGRIRLIDQANGGYIAAINRALAEARGDLIALLDADDVWLPDKTQRQVTLLQQRPELTLVFSDMTVVDASEAPLRPTLTGELPDFGSDAFGRVLWANVATQSSIMFRASLRALVEPIPPGVPYADWWFTLMAAHSGLIEAIREPLALYRQHGANLTGFVSGAAAARESLKALHQQLYALRTLELNGVSPRQLREIWAKVEEHAMQATQLDGSDFLCLPETGPDAGVAPSAAEAAKAGEAAAARGDLSAACQGLVKALAFDPGDREARRRFRELVEQAEAAERRPHPLRGAREQVVLVDAEEILTDEELLPAWLSAMDGVAEVTLAMDATRLDPAHGAAELQALCARCRVEEFDTSLLAVVGAADVVQRFRMLSGVNARLTAASSVASNDDLPRFTFGQLNALREWLGAPHERLVL